MSELASAVAEKVINSITPLFGELKTEILGSLGPMFEKSEAKIKKDILGSVASMFEELKIDIKNVEKRLDSKIDGVEKKLGAKIDGVENKLEIKIGGLGVQLSQMNLKLDTALSLVAAVPDLEDSQRSQGSRLKKVETDIEVLKLIVSRPAK